MLAEEEERSKHQKQVEDMSRFFLNAEGKPFDPLKKFGSIEDNNQLVYDNITSSYSLNLPPEYYLKMIQRSMPSLDTKD